MKRLLPILVLTAGCSHSPATPPSVSAAPASAPAAHGDHHHGDADHAHGDGHHGQDGEVVHHHRFDDPKVWAKIFDDPKRKAWQKPDEVVRLMEIAEGMSVADIGAGTGYFLEPLSVAVGESGRVFGLDVEPTLVAYMQKRATERGMKNVTANQVKPDDPSLDPKTDRVLIVNTWHHIAGRAAYAKKIHLQSAAGARLYIIDYTKEAPHGPPVNKRLPPEAVIKTLEEAGWTASVVEETLPHQYVVVGKK